MRVKVALSAALLLAACERESETIETCIARFSNIAQSFPDSSRAVLATYTFDLTPLDRERIGALVRAGLDGRGPPTIMATRDATPATVRSFERLAPGPRGSLFVSDSISLIRTPGRLHASASAAVRQGCAMLPGSRL